MSLQALTLPLARRRTALPGPAIWLIVPAIALVVVFLVIPYLNIVVMSFRVTSTTSRYAPGFTLENYAKALTDPFYLAVLWRTLLVTLTVTFACFAVGFPVAYHLARTTSRFRSLLYACVLCPLLVSAVIRCYGWMIVLANNGLINSALKQYAGMKAIPLMYNEFGVILGLVHINLPFMILPLLGALQNVDPSLEEAARSLGARRLTVMRRVVLPLAMPGIQSGAILVFVMAASSYVTPILLGGSRVKLMATMVVQQLSETFLWPFGAALAIVLASVSAALVFAWARVTQRAMKVEG